MNVNKQQYRRGKRLFLSVIFCIPIFWVISALLLGAEQYLIILINLVVAGTIIFTVDIIGTKREAREKMLHEKYTKEKEERDKEERDKKLSDKKEHDKEERDKKLSGKKSAKKSKK